MRFVVKNKGNGERRYTRYVMKIISVVLTKYSDLMSNFLYFLSGFGYTHVSVALDEMDEKMYSFNYKGFCEETLSKHRQHGVKRSMCFQLQVSDTVYERLQSAIEQFKAHKRDFCYTRIGVIFCFLRIPFKWKRHYFCSQFVAELLSETGAVQLKKSPSLYLPNHFCEELGQAGQLKEIQYNII